MIDLQQFKMNPEEEAALRAVLAMHKPQRIAEFGSGLTTRFWAENSEAKIVTWDNYPDWVKELQAAFAGATWLDRVEWRSYSVTPEGRRDVEKDAVPWDGEPFDFLFLDGPRSAHPQNFGRSGTFRFATQHASPGALIVWHDANRPHEKEMARRYFGHCRRFRKDNVGWCRWEKPCCVSGISKFMRKLAPFA